jgi:glycosyltransferase involved in cell wall biosynthesis
MAYLAIRHIIIPYDIILVNSPYQGAFLWLMRIRPTTITCVVYDFFFLQNATKSKFDRYSTLLYYLAIKNANRIIIMGDEAQLTLSSHYRKDGVIAPLGVARSLEIVTAGSALSRSNAVGYIGAYNLRKRTDRFFNLVNDPNFEGLKLVLAGRIDNDLENRLNKIHPEEVTIMGEIPESEKPSFYQSINYFYYPTQLEGFGMQIVECFKMGVLPILHNDASVPAMLKNHAVLVEDENEAITVIRDFTVNPGKREKLVESNRRYAEKFSWKHFADALIDDGRKSERGLYKEALQ